MSKAMQILTNCRNGGQKRAGGLSLDEAIAELYDMEAQLKPKTCEWHKEDDDDWRGECGCVWGFNGETPTKAEAYFCPQCGGKIIEIDIGDNK